MKNNSAEVDNLFSKLTEYDGLLFERISMKSSKESAPVVKGWDFSFFRFNNREDIQFFKTELGYIYYVLFFKADDEENEFFEAVLSDPQSYVRNLMNTNQEGFILKKSERSKKLMESLYKLKTFVGEDDVV